MEVLFTYKGFQYTPWEDHEPEECLKIYHEVIMPNGKKTCMDFSCYDRVTEDDFKKWVDLGMPTKVNKSFPLTSEDLARLYLNPVRFIRE